MQKSTEESLPADPGSVFQTVPGLGESIKGQPSRTPPGYGAGGGKATEGTARATSIKDHGEGRRG